MISGHVRFLHHLTNEKKKLFHFQKILDLSISGASGLQNLTGGEEKESLVFAEKKLSKLEESSSSGRVRSS